MDKSSPTYHSYLLRLWRRDNAGQPVSLEVPGSRTQLHFESLAALCVYLAQQLSADEKKKASAEE
jgi:hypothetical protein